MITQNVLLLMVAEEIDRDPCFRTKVQTLFIEPLPAPVPISYGHVGDGRRIEPGPIVVSPQADKVVAGSGDNATAPATAAAPIPAAAPTLNVDSGSRVQDLNPT
jgi:hypothetical protein